MRNLLNAIIAIFPLYTAAYGAEPHHPRPVDNGLLPLADQNPVKIDITIRDKTVIANCRAALSDKPYYPNAFYQALTGNKLYKKGFDTIPFPLTFESSQHDSSSRITIPTVAISLSATFSRKEESQNIITCPDFCVLFENSDGKQNETWKLSGGGDFDFNAWSKH